MEQFIKAYIQSFNKRVINNDLTIQIGKDRKFIQNILEIDYL